MALPLRKKYPEAFYHLTSRDNIFHDSSPDPDTFLSSLENTRETDSVWEILQWVGSLSKLTERKSLRASE